MSAGHPNSADTLTEMPAEEMSTAVVDLPFHHRVRIGISSGENWLQLIRFGVVGCSGYAVNTIVFALLLHKAGFDYKIALPIGYLAGVINNFIWNSRWTFSDKNGSHPAVQAYRFLIVSAIAFGVDYVIVVAFVHWTSMDKVIISMISNVMVIPVSFLGQKFWSFRH
jgi:putative flippase GtrA